VKHTSPVRLLSWTLLAFIRDHNPTVEAFMARFAGDHGQTFHVLRKHEVIVVEGGRVRISRQHLSPNGEQFVWGHLVFLLERDEVWAVRWGPEGPPVFAPDA